MASRKQLNSKTTDDIDSGSSKLTGKHSSLREIPDRIDKMDEDGEISPRGKNKSNKSKSKHIKPYCAAFYDLSHAI